MIENGGYFMKVIRLFLLDNSHNVALAFCNLADSLQIGSRMSFTA